MTDDGLDEDGGEGPAQDDPILANAKKLRAAGASVAQVRQYLLSKGYSASTPAPTGVHDESERPDAPEPPSNTQAALGGVAALVRDVPGAEAAQAGVRALVRGQPYRESLHEIRTAEDANPVSPVMRALGAGIAAAAIPGGTTMQGARFGVLHALGSADPSTVEDRLHSAVREGAIGAGTGYLSGRLASSVSGALRPTAGRTAASAAGSEGRTLFDEPRRLMEQGPTVIPTQPAIETALQARPVVPPSPREAAAQRLEALLQSKVDEGAAEHAASLHKGVPIGEVPTNWTLMEQIENALLKAKGPGARAPSVSRLRAIAEANP